MALQIWLPLDGTLENKGCADAVITNNGATIDTAGKIGSCYSFDGVNDYISVYCPKLYSVFTGGSQPFSVALWVYLNDSTRNILFNDYKTGIYTTNFISFQIWSDLSYRLYFGDNANKDWFDKASGVYTPLEEWTHLVCTYDGSSLKLYKNGICEITKTVTLPAVNKTEGDYWLGYDTRSTTALNGKLNDLRVYDHCLSAAEVHEISQGLTLHYKLDSSTNDLNWLEPVDEVTIERHSNENTSADLEYDARIHECTDTKFVFDFDAKGTADNMSIDVYFRKSSSSMYPISSKQLLTTDWKHYSLEMNGTLPSSFLFRIQCYKGTSGDIVSIRNPRLISANMPLDDITVIDSSGYGHHGISHNAYTTSEILARCSKTIDLTNTESYISGEYYASEEITFCAWVKFKTKKAAHVIDGRTSNGSGYQPFYCNTNGTIQTGGTGAYPNISCSFQIDRWYHYAVAYDSETIKCYVDGELIGSAAKGNSFNTMIPLTLASRCNQANYSDVYLSDFRIYCIALSQDDIKDLCQTSAKVDKLGNIHTFEFIEDDAMKIKKIGTVCNKEILENRSTIIHTSNGVTFKPSTGANKCSSNFSVVDMSNYLESDHPINISVDFDLEWTNFSFVEGKTPFLKIQGMNRKRADGGWAWVGTYPITNGFSLLQFMDSESGNCHAHYVTTIPVAWLELYNAQQVQIRCDYSDGNGTVKISNFIVTLGGDNAKFTKSYISANEFIER